ncbi:glycoside hydrolase family 18 protein [Flavobacterium agrisoli]|uniref:chitinase n=1 Tax=Flavobacterium agrisoli TaxID=2793066 RepID=A0A934UJZ7_9FLAO|nr:glycoside hydrolase family 18 protein [Flavobacterium agrisoli]MBK0370038.1 glycoside hydrolase family 18 protein [Flavobacterium agrisoli]
MKKCTMLVTALCCLLLGQVHAQKNKPLDIIAYYVGDSEQIKNYDTTKLSHIIFSFCHLKDGKLSVDSPKDSLTIKHLVGLKTKQPHLKIMLSLGGWGGCAPCSEAFSTAAGRQKFATSVKEINDYFKTDGIDLDWEYPTIEGHPGHLYQDSDKQNFSELIKILRKTLGKKPELSFAAGGFQLYLDKSVNWKEIMPLVNRVNIMSYDLVNGYATITGHQTPLYSGIESAESTNRAVEYLLKLGIPAEKLVIGCAFYTRIWENVSNNNNGLYQSGHHIAGVNFKEYASIFTKEKGWNYFWDEKAKAAYWYNAKEKKFATGDDVASVIEKTKYAKKQKLGGIMFWELTLDTPQNGLLDQIYKESKKQ